MYDMDQRPRDQAFIVDHHSMMCAIVEHYSVVYAQDVGSNTGQLRDQ